MRSVSSVQRERSDLEELSQGAMQRKKMRRSSNKIKTNSGRGFRPSAV